MDWLQQNGIWVVTWLLIVVGLVGTLLPILPGQVLIIVAAGGHWWVKKDESHLGWWTLAILVVILAVSMALEYVSGAVGSKYFGGSKWGVAGAIIGGLVGLFFAPWGFILGPLAGAFAFEYLFAKKEIPDATRSGVGSAVGTIMGLSIKLGLALAMAVYLVVDLFWI